MSEQPGGEPAVPVVELIKVGRTFPGPPAVQALADIDLVIGRGEYVSILGPSGSGKSTLLNLLGLLDRHSTGTCKLDGIDTASLREGRRAHLRGSRIGFVFQAFHLLGHRSVEENVELAMLYSGVAPAERKRRAEEALARVGLTHRLGFRPLTLSGGERQRVAIARAIVNRPSLLLADEPTGNLDDATTAQILDIFDELHADGLSLAVITHDVEVAARASRRVYLRNGQLDQARLDAESQSPDRRHANLVPSVAGGAPNGADLGG
ncbi:MAG: ABC transporter ATP-binding protein [Acidimicrobiales bacterium]